MASSSHTVANMKEMHELLEEDNKRKEMLSCPAIPYTIPVIKARLKSNFIRDLDDCLSIMYSSLLTFCIIRRYQNTFSHIDMLELQFLKPELRKLYINGRQEGNNHYHPSKELWEIHPHREDYHCIYIIMNNKMTECIIIRKYENLIHLLRSKQKPTEEMGVSFISNKINIQDRFRTEINSCIHIVRQFYSHHFSI